MLHSPSRGPNAATVEVDHHARARPSPSMPSRCRSARAPPRSPTKPSLAPPRKAPRAVPRLHFPNTSSCLPPSRCYLLPHRHLHSRQPLHGGHKPPPSPSGLPKLPPSAAIKTFMDLLLLASQEGGARRSRCQCSCPCKAKHPLPATSHFVRHRYAKPPAALPPARPTWLAPAPPPTGLAGACAPVGRALPLASTTSRPSPRWMFGSGSDPIDPTRPTYPVFEEPPVPSAVLMLGCDVLEFEPATYCLHSLSEAYMRRSPTVIAKRLESWRREPCVEHGVCPLSVDHIAGDSNYCYIERRARRRTYSDLY